MDVRHLIASLPSRLREPISLLRRPECTIKADLFAARAKLKATLAEESAA